MSWLADVAGIFGDLPFWVLISTAVVFALIVVFIIIQIWRYGVRKAKLPKTEDTTSNLNYVAQSMRSSFIAAHKAMKDFFPGFNYQYSSPVFLLIGPEDAAKTQLVNEVGLSSQLGQTVTGTPCNWSIFDRATVVDVREEVLLGTDRGGRTNKAWKELIKLFQKFRPRRPLDGLILAIPAETFADETHASVERLQAMAEAIHRSIGELQTRLGMALPIYLVITKSESLPGFTQATALLSDEHLSEAFGWASPYPTGAAYSNEWCIEAINDLVPRIQDAVNECLALISVKEQSFNDAILLPTAVERLRTNLDIFLGSVLRVSNFNKSAALRGIFFTGGHPRNQLFTHDTAIGKRAFVHGLLERKIFPEFALAYPFNLKLLSSNQRVRFSQIGLVFLVLLGAAGLLNSSFYLTEATRRLSASVTAISSSAEQLRLAHQDGLSTLDLVSVNEAVSVMNRLEAIGDTTLKLLTVPTTWFAELPNQIVEVMNLSYDRFLYEEMHLWLTARGTEITNSTPRSTRKFIYYHDTKAPVVQSIDPEAKKTSAEPDYAIVDNFLQELSEFERMVENYDRIQPDQDTIALRSVAKYLYDITLTQQFVESVSPTLFGGRTNKVTPINMEDLKIAARNKMGIVWENLIINWISRDGIINDLIDLSSAVNIQYEKASVSQTDYKRLQKIRETLGRLKKHLSSGRYDWIAKDKPELTPELLERLKTVEAQKLLGIQSKETLITSFNEIHRETRARLLGFPMPDIGSVIIVEDGKLVLSDHLHKLHTNLLAAESQDGRNNAKLEANLTQVDVAIPTDAPDGQYVLWDTQVLNAALSDAQSYQEILYRGQLTAKSNSSLDETVSRVTKYSLATRIASQINIAIKFKRTPYAPNLSVKEEQLSERVANFSAASKPLQGLFEILAETGSRSLYVDATELAISEALDIVEEVNLLLYDSNPYSAGQNNFENWDGTTPPLSQLIGLKNMDQVTSYTRKQRQRVALLAREYVSPALNFLLKLDANRMTNSLTTLSNWDSILQDLNAYETMQADNAVFKLETFIESYMASQTCSNISKIKTEDVVEPSWFQKRLSNLKDTLLTRCLEIRSTELIERYTALSKRFNSTLAGKAPFSLGSFYGTSLSEQSIKGYLRDFNAFLNRGGGDPMMLKFGFEQEPSIRRFIKKLDDLAYIFDETTNSENPGAPNIWIIEPEFRVNRKYEKHGDQVINWQVSSGNTTASLYNGVKRLSWSAGGDLKISFSWALNSKMRPVNDPKRSDLFVDGRTVTFSYQNEWALFSAIERNRTPPIKISRDENKNFHILHFKIPTVPNTTSDKPHIAIPMNTTEVFVALRLFGAEAKGSKRLRIPLMPTQAPNNDIVSKRIND